MALGAVGTTLSLGLTRTDASGATPRAEPTLEPRFINGGEWAAFNGIPQVPPEVAAPGSLNAATLALLAAPQAALPNVAGIDRTPEQKVIAAELGEDALKEWEDLNEWQRADRFANAAVHRIQRLGPPSDEELAASSSLYTLVVPGGLGPDMTRGFDDFSPELQVTLGRDGGVREIMAGRSYSAEWDEVARLTYDVARPSTFEEDVQEHSEAHLKWRMGFEAVLEVPEADKLHFRMPPALARDFGEAPPDVQRQIAEAVLSTTDSDVQAAFASLDPKEKERLRTIAAYVKASEREETSFVAGEAAVEAAAIWLNRGSLLNSGASRLVPTPGPSVTSSAWGSLMSKPPVFEAGSTPPRSASELDTLRAKATDAMNELIKNGTFSDSVELNGWASRFGLTVSPDARPARTSPLDGETRSLVRMASRRPGWESMGPAERAITLHAENLRNVSWGVLNKLAAAQW